MTFMRVVRLSQHHDNLNLHYSFQTVLNRVISTILFLQCTHMLIQDIVRIAS